MGENALKKELWKTRQKMFLLEDQLRHSRGVMDRRTIGRMIKKQYYLKVFLETCLNQKSS